MASLVIVCLFALVSITLGQALSPRINNGIPLDTFRRFPHHVTIITETYKGGERQCSGSIIDSRNILTTIGCVFEASKLTIIFNRLYSKESADSFSISMNSANVHLYPTEYDDLAICNLPVELIFNDMVQPISLMEDENLDGKFAVMPGFNKDVDRLTYGMFRVISNNDCKLSYGSIFDEYQQMCTIGWNNNRHVPCEGNEGGGLLIGWPKNPKLCGVFSTPLSCNSGAPAIYMKTSKYIDWINSVTNGTVTPTGTTIVPSK